MRIAMVSEHASPLAALGGEDAGGQNVHVAALAIALADRGHCVEVYTRQDAPELARVVPLHRNAATGGRVDVVHVPAGPATAVPKDALPPYMPAFGEWIARRWLRSGGSGRPDVVHAHFWMSGLAALRARERTGVPVVQTFHALGAVKRRHQGDRDTSPAGRLGEEARLAADADAVVATCSDEVAELLALGAPADRLHVAPCGVDLRAFTPDGPVAAGQAGRRRILSIGRLVERKGVDTLVAALAHLPQRLPDGSGVELVVAGGPDAAHLDGDPEVRRLRELARAAGVGDRVRFVGRVTREDVPALLRSADVVACVPWYEPFGIVPLEAMACGVPVVAAGVGGILDSVEDGVTGLHVPPREPVAVARALGRLLADEALRTRMGRAGAERVTARFGWPRVAELTEAVYDELLEGGAGARVDGPAPAALRQGGGSADGGGALDLTGGTRERALA